MSDWINSVNTFILYGAKYFNDKEFILFNVLQIQSFLYEITHYMTCEADPPENCHLNVKKFVDIQMSIFRRVNFTCHVVSDFIEDNQVKPSESDVSTNPTLRKIAI